MDESHPSLVVYGVTVFALYLIFKLTVTKANALNLDHIPTVGPSGLTSYFGALKYICQSRRVTQEGYKKHRNGVFKVALMDRWIVFCCGHQFAEDIRRASDDELGSLRAFEELVQMKYTFGEEVVAEPFHVPVIRSTLTRNLGICFPDIREEIVQSFEDVLSLEGNEWRAIPAMTAILSIVCRTSNRLFVGLPMCRDPDCLALIMKFTVDVVKTAAFINLFPGFLKPVVGRCTLTFPAYIKRTTKHLAPIIEERLRKEADYRSKDWPDKPNDYITWLLEEAKGHQRTLRSLILRVLAINFSAIHSSSMAFTHALYHLAANPQYASSLREEVKSIVKEGGWTKASLDRMSKVDSFLRESQRFNGLGSTALSRKVLKDFKFSDGTILPAGTLISVPLYATHRDETNYKHPDVFDPFRFSKLRESGNGDGPKHQMVTPSLDYIAWGLGKHACPGRFFAAIELKAMLAHVVVSYDVKFQNEGERPPNEWFAASCVPSRTAEVMFRRRAA